MFDPSLSMNGWLQGRSVFSYVVRSTWSATSFGPVIGSSTTELHLHCQGPRLSSTFEDM